MNDVIGKIDLGTGQGWQCPVCGYVYGPNWAHCSNCNKPENEKYKTSTEGDNG